MNQKSKIALLACQDCSGIRSGMLPELMLLFDEQIQIMPVSCPANLKPLSFVSLLKNGWGGLLVLCPKDNSCCPKKAKSIARKEGLKNILPVFGISKERLEIVSAAPFEIQKVKDVLEGMIEVIRLESQADLLSDEREFEFEAKSFLIN